MEAGILSMDEYCQLCHHYTAIRYTLSVSPLPSELVLPSRFPRSAIDIVLKNELDAGPEICCKFRLEIPGGVGGLELPLRGRPP